MNKLVEALKAVMKADCIRDAVSIAHEALSEHADNKEDECCGRCDGLNDICKFSQKNGWINVKDRLPKFIEGKDYLENVLAWCNNELMVLCLSGVQWEDDNCGIAWCNCYGKINSEDAEFDDEYNPTHWQPLPQKPTE